ncbi:hypothetical protein BCR33DRAFT_717599 [Rhizoclosmatium globosum]|uniref:Uncharacterized protein n=1 Tax=Rhizoclosmatium globosum TaxID=329046 RepID=A0A1Y2C8K4_9FUNG|nr:hypothetical protein BCR33DRAFT_717599 [Rhizoclosmatium globosum]|eukprot:ORY43370.1 hypothetical protein BCR33DRAFT_717599 [Rhizoclosmatium globosum]
MAQVTQAEALQHVAQSIWKPIGAVSTAPPPSSPDSDAAISGSESSSRGILPQRGSKHTTTGASNVSVLSISSQSIKSIPNHHRLGQFQLPAYSIQSAYDEVINLNQLEVEQTEVSIKIHPPSIHSLGNNSASNSRPNTMLSNTPLEKSVSWSSNAIGSSATEDGDIEQKNMMGKLFRKATITSLRSGGQSSMPNSRPTTIVETFTKDCTSRSQSSIGLTGSVDAVQTENESNEQQQQQQQQQQLQQQQQNKIGKLFRMQNPMRPGYSRTSNVGEGSQLENVLSRPLSAIGIMFMQSAGIVDQKTGGAGVVVPGSLGANAVIAQGIEVESTPSGTQTVSDTSNLKSWTDSEGSMIVPHDPNKERTPSSLFMETLEINARLDNASHSTHSQPTEQTQSTSHPSV